MTVVWHIFGKDVRLLWPLVAMVGLLQFASAGTRLALGHFGDPPQLALIASLLSGMMFLGIAILIIAAVQQDTVPGMNQDWLVRPISRRDLVLAKLLFLLIAVHGPMMASDLSRGFVTGIPFREAMPAALSRSAALLLTFDLPVAALATVTVTAVEAIGGALAIWLIVAAAIVAGSGVRGGPPAFAGTGLQWMMPTYWSIIAVAIAAVVIPLQYLRRETAMARRIVVAGVILAPMLSFSSWAEAFSIQQQFSPFPAAAEPVKIAFDPSLGRNPGQGQLPSGGAISLPIRVTGLTPYSVLKNDRAVIRLSDSSGATLYAGPTGDSGSSGDDFPVRTGDDGNVRTFELIKLPQQVLEKLRNRPVRMEIEYSLTLLRLTSATSLDAMAGNKRLAGFGWCETKDDEDGDDIVVGCLKTGHLPDCVAGTLQDRVSGQRNPEDFQCHPDYAPFAVPYLDIVHQFDGELEFRDLKGLAKYPVSTAQLGTARMLLNLYRPLAHFTRRLIVPDIRLSDWVVRQ